MADDSLLLELCRPGTLWLRFYGWTSPAFSFGVFQALGWVRTRIPEEASDAVLVRRPTGGGLVDHRGDWTYTLVVPAGHFLAEGPATETYRQVHAALAETLAALAAPAALAPCAKACGLPAVAAQAPAVCFERPETHDVLASADGRKLAGAALRRTRAGLLLQGSVAAHLLPGVAVSDFEAGFRARLALLAGAETGDAAWPFAEDDPRRRAEVARFADPAWTARR